MQNNDQRDMYRAFLLPGELRYLYRLPRKGRRTVRRLVAWASRSELKPFIKLACTIRKTQDRRARSDPARDQQGTPRGAQQRVRLISHRANGFHSPEALIAMVYLRWPASTIALPHR